MKNVCVCLATGFEEIEAITIIDVLRRGDIPVTTTSMTGQKEVVGAHNITVIADMLFEEMEPGGIEMIVLPGGMPGAKNLGEHTGLRNKILDFHRNGQPLGAICAAPMVFGELGILENKDATCFPGFEKHLKGARFTGEAVTQAGNIVTGKGVGVAIPFALKIVENLKGREFADALKKRMVVP